MNPSSSSDIPRLAKVTTSSQIVDDGPEMDGRVLNSNDDRFGGSFRREQVKIYCLTNGQETELPIKWSHLKRVGIVRVERH